MTDRCLVLAARLPFPLDDGWKVRTFHVVREIARVMPVTLVFFEVPGADSMERRRACEAALEGRVALVGIPEPEKYNWWRTLLGVLSPSPIHVWNHRSTEFHRAVQQALESGEVTVGVSVCAFMYPYLEGPSSPPFRIVDTHNVDSDLMRRYVTRISNPLRRLYARITASKLEALEDRVFTSADRVWVCSGDESGLLKERMLGGKVRVVPNGVDVEGFQAVAPAVVPGRVLFFGRLDYFPNQDGLEFLVDEIIPQMEALGHDFEVKVVGAGATSKTEEVCGRSARVELVGRVDDVRPWLASAALVVVPLRMGSGTRLKVLEAMAAGRPVISTRIGAEGIVAERGLEVLEADDAVAFARLIARVLDDSDYANAVGSAGREAVRSRYDWVQVGVTIREELYLRSGGNPRH